MDNGIITIASAHSADDTVAKLLHVLESKDVKVFAVVDHCGEAAKIGLSMPNTKLVIFGNPAAGTPLMLASPSVALDLPLKILVAEDKEGKVWVSCNSLEFLQERHGLSDGLMKNIVAVSTLAEAISE